MRQTRSIPDRAQLNGGQKKLALSLMWCCC
jgi:hypothetical protein